MFSLKYTPLLPRSVAIAEVHVERVLKSEVVEDYKETVSSKHTTAHTHMNAQHLP